MTRGIFTLCIGGRGGLLGNEVQSIAFETNSIWGSVLVSDSRCSGTMIPMIRDFRLDLQLIAIAGRTSQTSGRVFNDVVRFLKEALDIAPSPTFRGTVLIASRL